MAMPETRLVMNPESIEDYRTFLKVKALPKFRFEGRTAIFPEEYADRLGLKRTAAAPLAYTPSPFLFDYQQDITQLILHKRKFAVFADCGLGKTLMFLEVASEWIKRLQPDKSVLIVSPLMVIPQTIDECKRFYGDKIHLRQVRANELVKTLRTSRGEILITNYDALTDDLVQGNIGALILDESSMLKSHYGKWGQTCLRLGKGLEYKLCCTGTPAPNDRIEYANHAVFMDAFPTINSFLAKFFINRGQTDSRWELKHHALKPFYTALSHWCIFLQNPATYGWKDNCDDIPPIKIHIHEVPLTTEQQDLVFDQTGSLFADQIGGITNRSSLSQLAKGSHRGKNVPTHKVRYIQGLVDSWPDESTIIWCKYNREQELLTEAFPHAHSISGMTTHDNRLRMINEFKSGECKVLISKPKILGFGLNLQRATRQVFSGLQDSYEEFYQAVKRSNRYGSTRPLNVHIPVTDIERPMIDTVLRKAKMVQEDTEQQEQIFREVSSTFRSHRNAG